MRSLRTLLVMLCSLRICHLVSGFKPSIPPPKDAQVLVIGASGRVGGEVVNRLSKQGYKVRAMIREPNTFFPLKKDLGTGPVEIVLGNVLDRDPERRHPYYVNYLGVKNLVDAALATGCGRVVRVTGLSVGLSELHPLAFLLNFCLSMAIMWQYEAEKVLREATERGLDYTIVRPGGLTDLPRPKNSCLVLGSDGKPPSMFQAMPFYRINRRDVADLLVAAMAEENTRRATLSCSWGRDPKGPKSWKSLLAKVKSDMSPLPLRRYRQATVFLGTVMTAAIMAVIIKISYIRYSIITRKKQKGFLV